MEKRGINNRSFFVVKNRLPVSPYLKRAVKLAQIGLILAILFTPTAYAAPNYQINYQGKLADSAGDALGDGTYSLTFKLYTGSTGGTALWTETWATSTTKITVTDGLFSVMLGSITSIASIDFNQTLYLGVTVEADAEMTPRKILGTVPSAFEADKLDGLTSADFLSTSTTAIPNVWSATGLGQIGSSTATTTFLGNLATVGDTIINGLFSAYQKITAPYFTATSTDTASTFPYASTTAITATTASTTNLIISSLGSGLTKVTNGIVSLATAGTDYLATYDAWQHLTTNFSTTTSATSSPLWAKVGLYASSTSYFDYASTTALTITGNAYLGTLTGPLQANAGAVSATSTIGVRYGGTGLTTDPSYGQLLLGNSSAGYTLTATSSLGIALTDTTGILPIANGGTNASVLNSTQLLYFDGTRIAGTSTPTASYFIATSTALASVFPYASTTALTVSGNSGLNVSGASGTSTFAGGLAIETSGFVYDYTSNNVGIGTAAARAKLHVSIDATEGTSAISAVTSGLFQRAGSSASANYVSILAGSAGQARLTFGDKDAQDTGYLQWDNAIDKFSLMGGNVGIGTTTPFTNLEVAGAGSNQSGGNLRLSNTTAGLTQNQYVNELQFYQSDATAGLGAGITNALRTISIPRIISGDYFGTVARLGFFVSGNSEGVASDNATLEALTLMPGGKIGIGTTTPGEKLSVDGNGLFNGKITGQYFIATSTALASVFPYASTTAITITNSSSGAVTSPFRLVNANTAANSGISLDFRVAASDSVTGRITNLQDASDAQRHLTFSTLTAGGALTEKLRITGAGNVGIGSTTPTYLLSLNSGTSAFSVDTGGVATSSVFNAVSTSLPSIFPYASTTALTVSGAGNLTIDTTNTSPFNISSTLPRIILTDSTAGEDDFTISPNSDYLEIFSSPIRDILVITGATRTSGAGYVGIGTTTPSAQLSASSTSAIGLMIDQRGTDDILRLLDAGTNVFTVKDGGNVGIGTTSPYSLLSIGGAAAGTLASVFNSVGQATIPYASTTALTVSGSGNSFNVTNSSATSTIVGDVNIAGSTGVTIWTNEGSSLVAQGSLNIGGNTPRNGFSVTRLGGTDAAFARFIEAGGAFAQFSDGTGIQMDFRDTGVNSRARIDTNGDSYMSPASGNVYFAPAAGNVGVATATPQFALTSFSSTASQLALSAGAGLAQWAFGNLGGNLYMATTTLAGTATSSPAAFELVGSTGAITTKGDLTIGAGTGNPGLQLQEAGTMRWTIYNDNTNDRLYITDDDNDNGVYIAQDATSWTANSDIRLKENVVPIEDALSKILSLTGYTYNFKGTLRREIGLVAQEVQPLFPELIDAGGVYLGLTYDRLGPIIIQAIKEQQAQIDSLAGTSGTSTALWTLDDVTGRLKPLAPLDLNNQELINVKAIASASGNWSIGEDGTLTASRLCLGVTCINETELGKLLELRGLLIDAGIIDADDPGEGGGDGGGGGGGGGDTGTTTPPSEPEPPTDEPAPDIEPPVEEVSPPSEPELETPDGGETPTESVGADPAPEPDPPADPPAESPPAE